MSLDDTNSLWLHVDPFSGAAGDMFLAACLDASPDPAALLSHVQTSLAGGMPDIADEFHIRTKRVWRGGMGSIAATHVTVWSRWGEEAAPIPLPADSNDDADADAAHPHSHHHHSPSHNHAADSHTDSEVAHSRSAHNAAHDDAGLDADATDSSQDNAAHSAHSHAHAHSYSNSHGHEHEHQHQQHQHHHHNHSHSHNHNHNDTATSTGPLRSLPEIRKLLEAADPVHIPPQVAHLALSVFTVLARAEASVHGAATSDAVHFHEVGAIDSIVDTIGTLLALHRLGIDLGDAAAGRPPAISCGPLPAGTGSVWTQHGQLPVPAFAAMKLLVGLPMCPGPGAKSGTVTGELVTPTGAALLRVLTGKEGIDTTGSRNNITGDSSHTTFPNFTPIAIGCGAGSKDFVKWPNVMRIIVGNNQKGKGMKEPVSHSHAPSSLSSSLKAVPEDTGHLADDSNTTESINTATILKPTPPPASLASESSALWNTDFVTQIIANIDDMTPEHLSRATEVLLENGALDVWTHPIIMKKGRVAQSLNCLCKSDGESSACLLELIFRHTTTLGVRIERTIERATLQRKFVRAVVPCNETVSGEISVKIGMLGDDVVSCKAEYDECVKLAISTGLPVQDIARKAEDLAKEKLGAS